MIRFSMPKLRIYQQILIGFGLIVTLPLVGVTFIINHVNQQAMKKELGRFTEHTAEALYRDFKTEMSWQKQQSQMMANLMVLNLSERKSVDASAREILDLDGDIDAVGLYDKQGHLIQSHYRNFESVSPELRLPDQLFAKSLPTSDKLPPTLALPRKGGGDFNHSKMDNHFGTGNHFESSTPLSFINGGLKSPPPLRGRARVGGPGLAAASLITQPFQVIDYTDDPQDSPYYLRATLALHQPGPSSQYTYYVQQKHFKYLQKLVQSNNSLYGAFYIVDNDGYIIAGPPNGADLQVRISHADYRQFMRIKPGVTHLFASTPLAEAQPSHAAKLREVPGEVEFESGNDPNLDSDDTPPLQKVIVKMPDINWGIIIESPYNLKQKYIKTAATQTLMLIIGCLMVILLLLLPYILGINRNFRQLIKGVKAMGGGNYFRRIRLLTNSFTPYEIVYLTLEFNRMARKTADSWQTIQEANRKLAQMDQFKSNLIDTVSHELRTPLTSIKGYTSRLLRYDHSLEPEVRIKSLKIVKQQAERLSRLVEDLLVIPDLETVNLRVFPDEVELAPLLENAVQFIQAKEHREIRVTIESRLPIPLSVMADLDRLEQIVLNLLDNAVKYSLPDTPIALRVEAVTQDVSQNEVPNSPENTTNDEGTPPKLAIIVQNICDPLPMKNLETLDSLFDKFKRLDDSLIRTTRGSGLGLFITRGLVEAMGGTIRLFYQEGCFQVRFTLPMVVSAPVEALSTVNH